MCFWCWRTIADAFSTALWPLTPQQNGPLSNCAKLSLGTRHRYLLRDRDRIFGQDFVEQVKAMGIKQVLSTPRSPWQRAYVERVIGTIRRKCLDHRIVFSEQSLRRTLALYGAYYHRWRTHLSLDKDAPQPRQTQLPKEGQVIETPEVGGLHHHYERRAA